MYIICLSGLENYEYAVHKLWWMQCLEEKKKQLQGGENCMTNFTIKLSSPNDYGEPSQPSGGRTDIFVLRTLQYVLNIDHIRS